MDENLQQLFLRLCKTNQFEINPKQVEIINLFKLLLEAIIFIRSLFRFLVFTISTFYGD